MKSLHQKLFDEFHFGLHSSNI